MALVLFYCNTCRSVSGSSCTQVLSDVEKGSSQLEKECLAIFHGCEKFRTFIGGEFTVLSDHKPLVQLLNNPVSVLPLRMERWSLQLQKYKFNIKHIDGSDNPADYFSRHCQIDSESIAAVVTENDVNLVVYYATPYAISTDDIRDYTRKDDTLQALIHIIRNRKWDNLENLKTQFHNANIDYLKIYRRIQAVLTINNSPILRRNRIVIPACLEGKMISLVHESHMGICKITFSFRALMPRLNIY